MEKVNCNLHGLRNISERLPSATGTCYEDGQCDSAWRLQLSCGCKVSCNSYAHDPVVRMYLNGEQIYMQKEAT